MFDKEALSRILINRMLITSGWRLLDDGEKKKNVILEQGYRAGKTTKFTDYLLLDTYIRPLAVIEAKKADYPLKSAKTQAMDYCRSMNVNYFYLSNGEEHYFAAVKDGALHSVDSFLSQEELQNLSEGQLDRTNLLEQSCDNTILTEIKILDVKRTLNSFVGTAKREFLSSHRIKFLRGYQVDYVKAIIDSAQKGNSSFLLKTVTGTGKTLTFAAIIEVVLQSKNAHRVLFLVDRIELENQAKRAFDAVFNNGQHYTVNIYKEGKVSWRSSKIMITTVQSLLAQDRYKKEFLPSGIAFFDEKGLVVLCNRKMHSLCFALMGKYLQLESDLKNVLENLTENSGVKKDLYNYVFPDGTVWRFSTRTVKTEKTYTKYVATDIPELYSKKQALEGSTAEHEQMVENMRRINDNVVAITHEEELLFLKMHLHSMVGESLQLLSKYRGIKNFKNDKEQIFTQFENVVRSLMVEAEIRTLATILSYYSLSLGALSASWVLLHNAD